MSQNMFRIYEQITLLFSGPQKVLRAFREVEIKQFIVYVSLGIFWLTSWSGRYPGYPTFVVFLGWFLVLFVGFVVVCLGILGFLVCAFLVSW